MLLEGKRCAQDDKRAPSIGRSSLDSSPRMMLRVAIDASGGVGVGVRFLDRNREVDVGTVHAAATTAIRAGWEDGLGAKAGLSNERAHVTAAGPGGIEPERPLTP